MGQKLLNSNEYLFCFISSSKYGYSDFFESEYPFHTYRYRAFLANNHGREIHVFSQAVDTNFVLNQKGLMRFPSGNHSALFHNLA